MRAPIAGTAFAVLASLPAVAELPARGPWTTPDRNAAIEVATETAAASSPLLLDLADVLEQAGDLARAREAASRAGLLLPRMDGKADPFTRRRVASKLAELGNVAAAEALVGPDAPPAARATLLGYIGAARAGVGDLAGAQRQLAAIKALLAASRESDTSIRTSTAGAMREIGLALVADGKPDEALELATALPNGLPKVWILGRSAQALCKGPEWANEHARGRAIAAQAADATRSASPASNPTADWFGLVTIAGEALAVCDGPETASAFVRELVSGVRATSALNRMAGQFTSDGDTGLAAALAPPPAVPDPGDAEGLLDAAMRLATAGNTEAARRLEVQASQVTLSAARATGVSLGQQIDRDLFLARLGGELAKLGAYDEAFATIQPIGPVNRVQYYVTVVSAAVTNNDAAAVGRIVPIAVNSITALGSGHLAVVHLYGLTRLLALASYRDAARQPYRELQARHVDGSPPGSPLLPSQAAELQVLMGDVEGAFATADGAGPLTAKVGAGSAAIYLGLATGGDRPTAGQVVNTAGLANRERPGPRAQALRAIALTLAGQGDLTGAWRAEAGLEGEPGDVLAGVRDDALAAIADAQVRGGNLRGAFATVRRIAQPDVRLKFLLVLMATPSQP